MRDDGTGPSGDCQWNLDDKECPMRKLLERNTDRSHAHEQRCGRNTGPQDEDANGGWSQIVRAMEDEG
jgi:hypothetical protein